MLYLASFITWCSYFKLVNELVSDRIKSAAMMRSVRMASGRRRYAPHATGGAPDYVVYEQMSPSAAFDSCSYGQAPLDPLWAALEKKLLL